MLILLLFNLKMNLKKEESKAKLCSKKILINNFRIICTERSTPRRAARNFKRYGSYNENYLLDDPDQPDSDPDFHLSDSDDDPDFAPLSKKVMFVSLGSY